ncbi:hypothetical protein SLEP1_g55988 [Rubroshorea leprosula]|uniref:Integrase catalytic domain-containing protein n=1 Tax=Rubroshorea leprosula TaxID=152421 RepID=A0AAV5MKB6_9ROSI|nr:hypothetical protein SLEP1_g55988 [Rubroshorea leprosula]
MAMGKILARLIPDDPLIPLLNRDAQPAVVVATRNSPALSNIIVPTKPRGSGKLNNEPSSSKHSEELMRKNADLERQLRDVQKSIDELKSPRSHQQTLDLDNAPLNLSITVIMRIQNANDAMMCKVFPATLKSTARRWYHKLPRHSIDSYSQLAKLFSNKFASQREIKRTATKLMQVHQKEGESLRDYMQRFNKATLDIDNVPDTICLSALLHGLKPGRFLDDLLENPPKSWNDGKEPKQPEGRDEKKKQKVGEQRGKPPSYPKYDNYIPLSSSRSQILAQIQHWVKRPPPQTHDSSRADRSKYCDYHRGYGHNTEDCQSLKDKLEFLARNGKLEGNPTPYQAGQYSSEPNRAYRGRPFNRRGQGQKASTYNQKDHRGVGYSGIPPPSGTINMISGGMHAEGPSARGRKAYARQVMTVNKNRPLKRPFEEAEWENAPITFSPTDYKRAEGEPDVMMPHADPFVATVHIGNHNVNKVFIDTGSSPDMLYWSCFQKMQLNPSSLQKYEWPIYGFDNQPILVEGVITLPIYVGSEPRFRITLVSFLVMKMESAFNAILGRATICELKAIISQPHLCMKFPTPQGVGVLKRNQKMARACYQDTFKKVELAAAPAEPVETVALNPDVPERTVKIGTKLTEEERAELLEFLRVNQDVFAWSTDEMQGIPAELTVYKLSTDPTKRPVLVERAAGHERMSFLDASSGYHQVQLLLDNQEKTAFYAGDAIYCYVMMPFGLKNAGATYQKLVQIIFKLQIDRNIEVYVDDMIVTSVRAEDHIADLSETFQNLRRAQMKLNPLKCTFAIESGKFLRCVVSKKRIEVNPEKVQAVQQMEPPKTIKDVQRLTGRVAALHRFIARSAERCLPFFKALREPKNFQWTDECQQVFDKLKQYLASAPLLSKPVGGESLYLYLGVTEEATSSVLLREENKHQKFICYKPKLSGRLIGWSVELSEYDLKFQLRTTIKGQAVADFLVECISATVEEKAPEHSVWVLYVDGAANIEGLGVGAVLVGPYGFKSEHALRFKFQTTNNAAEYEALIYGLKLKSRFVSFQIDKIPRADNHQADELSKLASSQDLNPHRSTIVKVLDAPSYIDFTVECQLLSTDPSSPSWTTPLIDYLHSGELPEDPSAAKLIKRRAAHFTLLDNQLYKRAASIPLLRCLTPYEAEYAVREVHEGVCGTHIGGRTSAQKLLRHGYYWPTMVEDAQKYGVNLLGPFVKGKGGCTYLVVAMDYFTKWIEAKPLSTTTERKIEEFLFNSILCRFGIPKQIIADNGPQFQAAALRSFCNDYGIELALTSVYTPQSNGQAESANKIVLRGLKTRVLAAHSNWVDELNKVLWSCRTTPSSATGETPFSLTYGAEAVIPVEVGLPSERVGRHNDPNNEQLLRENLDLVEEVKEMSRIRNMAHQSRVAKFYNKRVRARQFQVDDLVLRKAGLTNVYSHMGKLAPNWEGPYMVISIQRPGSY